MADNEQALHQPDGIHARGVLWGGAAIVLGIVLAALASWLLWRWWNAPAGPNSGDLPAPASPPLQSAPQPERAAYFAEKRKLLESWEWIDRQNGIARIPVEEAMRIMAARGAGNGKGSTEEGR